MAMISCSKSNDGGGTADFQPITFKFGPDATAITISSASQVVKNLPRSSDVTQLTATADLPAGSTISPDPTTAKDYTKGVTYTVTTSQGKSYIVQITAPAYDATNNPYGIYTPKHLSDIRNGMTYSYVLVNDIQMPDLTAANAATSVGISDYKDYGWYSIGCMYVNGGHVIFTGSLDGQNHVIKNFAAIYRSNINPAGIDAGHNGKNCDGLFGFINHATLKNIGIQLSSVGINDMTQTGDGYGSVGALVGRADSSTITNCYVTGSATITGGQYSGSLVGTTSSTTISKCYASITPSSGSYAINISGEGGGLIGRTIYGEVSDSYTNCSVIGITNVGGLIGSTNATNVKSCYAAGNVVETPMNTTGSLLAPNNLGGLIGTANSISPTVSSIQNCYATGAVTGANGSNSSFHMGTRIGGLIGQIGIGGSVSVMFSYATGSVTRVWTSATTPYLIGGLVGSTPNNVFITSSQCTNYWDKATTGQNYLGGGNGALAQDNAYTTNGKSSAEMKSGNTYINWDFSTVWNVSASTNNGYPYLRSTK